MRTLISTGDHVLGQVLGQLPFCWYADHGPSYRAEGRNDGLVYIGGFSTREKAEEWAVREGIMPKPEPEDPQGCL